MSYYLGKVGRAGARLVSSCKDLYNDVNAAYLTGAVDIIAIRQRDGSLKSTPFHVRFGKLGVLRTGDIKEVSWKLSVIPLESISIYPLHKHILAVHPTITTWQFHIICS